MNDEEFEKYFERIDEIYFMFQDSGFFGDDVKKDKIKEILEEIYNKGYEDGEPAKWTIHYPKNVKRG